MTRYSHGYRIQGHSMNTYSGAGLQERDEIAPRQEVTYYCQPGCVHSPFTVPLAAEAGPPAGWECRCGRMARLEGAPADAELHAPPRYGPCDWQARGERPPKSNWEHVLERRTRADLEALLTERISTMRGGMS